jgi:hypothetical protein
MTSSTVGGWSVGAAGSERRQSIRAARFDAVETV